MQVRALDPIDTLVVWKLDRLGRSPLHLVETVNDLAENVPQPGEPPRKPAAVPVGARSR